MTLKIKNIVKFFLLVFLTDMFLLPVLLKRTLPMVTEITTLGSIAIIFLECLVDNRLFNQIFKSVLPMVMFFVYLIVSSMILLFVNNYDVSAIFSVVEMIALMIIVMYIVFSDGDMDYIAFLGIFLSVVLGVYTLFNRDALMDTLNNRLELAGNLTPNATGLIMSFGVLGTYLIKGKIFKWPVKLLVNLLCVYVIILTASRQSILVVGVIYGLWLLHVWKGSKNQGNKKKIVLLAVSLFVVVVAVGLLYSGALDWILRTKLFDRVNDTDAATTVSDQARNGLYKIGIKTFLASPLIGCGYANIGVYTHSTYMEILGGTGLIGTVIFYFPMFALLAKTIKKLKVDDTKIRRIVIDTLVMIIVLFVMMFFRMINNYIASQIILALAYAGNSITDYSLRKKDLPEMTERH